MKREKTNKQYVFQKFELIIDLTRFVLLNFFNLFVLVYSFEIYLVIQKVLLILFVFSIRRFRFYKENVEIIFLFRVIGRRRIIAYYDLMIVSYMPIKYRGSPIFEMKIKNLKWYNFDYLLFAKFTSISKYGDMQLISFLRSIGVEVW